MSVEIVERESFKVAGLKAKFIHALSPDANAAEILGPLWGRMLERVAEFKHRVGHDMYGIVCPLAESDRSHPDELAYVCGVPVSEEGGQPDDFDTIEIPGGTYAKITHRGLLADFAKTVGEIYRGWLPDSGYKHAGTHDIELYDERYKGDAEDSEIDYFIPIRILE